MNTGIVDETVRGGEPLDQFDFARASLSGAKTRVRELGGRDVTVS
jgi:hypothetical protein